MANPWDNDPIVSGNPWDNDPIVDVVSQGGPRSLMSRTLDEMDPQGAGRRAGRREYMQGPEYARMQNRGALDAMARNMPGVGPLYGALRHTQYADPEGAVGNIAGRGANMLAGGGSGIAQGALFSFDDELMGLISEDAKRVRRQQQRGAEQEAPVSNFAGQVVGGVVSPASKPIAAASGAKAGMTLKEAAMAGARGGFLGGGLYGTGYAEGGLGERIDGATSGALWGAAGGAALGPALQPVINKASTGQFFPKGPGASVLNTARQQLGVPDSSIKALRQVLRNSGYSGDDVDRGIVNIADRLKVASESGDRAGLFALELQKEFPAAQQNIQDVFQQLMTAPPRQGQTGRILTQALDDQYDSQGTYIEGVAQQRLGTATVADELRGIGERRAQIGDVRDRTIKYAATDARGRGIREKQMTQFLDDFSDDAEVMGAMRAAARQLGYSGKNEVANAAADNPALLLQKFGEVSGAQVRSARGASPVLARARDESELLFDEMSRFTREADNQQFAKKDTGEKGPYRRSQQEFAENYSQEEAIQTARTMLQKSRDPVAEDGIALWFESLPEGEQQLVRTVWRQDLEKMLRGGNIDQDGAYLTNLKKLGLNSTIKRVLGEDGEAISRAIGQIADEQKGLVALDPRKGLQERVVRGPSADRARNLYTTNPIARMGDRLPAMSQLADIAFMTGGQLPYVTMAKQGAKMFRPRPPTREGLARILAMRLDPNGLPPPTGTLSRMPGTAAPVAGASSAQQATGAPRMTASQAPQPAPWRPVQIPQQADEPIVARIQTGAQQRAEAAIQKQRLAQQAIADAQAAQADEAAIRPLLIAAQEADAEARIAVMQARNAARMTKEKLQAVKKATRDRVRAARRASQSERRIAREENRAAIAASRADTELESALTYDQRSAEAAEKQARALRDRSGANRLREGADKRANERIASERIEQAKNNATAKVDPLQTFNETGEFGINIAGVPFVIRDAGIKTEAQFLKAMQRIEDDVLGANAGDKSKWSRLTRTVDEITGTQDLRNEIMKGEYSGWRTPRERTNHERNMKAARTAKKYGPGIAGAATLALGTDTYIKESRRERVRQLTKDPEFVKSLQRALKAAGEYEGRADGKYDFDVQSAVARFQGNRKIHTDPGTLDQRTLDAIEDHLAFYGKEKEARQLREAQKAKR